VEVKIGVQQAQRELVLDVDEPAEAIEKLITEALASETGVISLTDSKGRKVVIPGAKVAYVEIGTGVAGMVGFRS
jgi:F420-0:gamma-glutamyl ligase